MLHGLKNMKHKFVTHLKAFRKFVCQNEQHLTTCNRDIATRKENWCVPRTHQLVTNLYLIINKNFCMMKKHLFWKNAVLALSMMLLSVGAFAQQHEVKGTVLDESQLPIPGANVVIKGTTVGTITTGNGEFTMNAADGDVLQVSYIGYNTEEVTVSGNGPYTVSLVLDMVGLDEVVVVGYGVQKKSNVTGAISSIKAEELERRSSTNAVQAMQGKAAGVQVISSSAAPGAGSDIRVRGYSSNSSNIGPLLIVDGLKVENITYLDPAMIESMEVLKDAASAAIYGAEAGNGVVLITTKNGGKQDGKIFYNFQYSTGKLGRSAQMMDEEAYVGWQIEGHEITMDKLKSQFDYVEGTNTNWADVIYGSSVTQRHTFGAQGGNDRGSFYVAITNLNENGIVKGNKDTYKRLTAQLNADYKIKKWFSVSTNTSIERWEQKGLDDHYEYGGNIFLSSYLMDPITPVYYSDAYPMPKETKDALERRITSTLSEDVYEEVTEGEHAGYYTKTTQTTVDTLGYYNVYGDDNGYYAVGKYYEGDAINPLIKRDQTDKKKTGFNIRGTVSADFKPFNGLVITSRFGYRIRQQKEEEFQEPRWGNPKNSSQTYLLKNEAQEGFYYQWENFANYNKSFGAHNVGAMVGMSYVEDYSYNIGAQIEGQDILKNYADNFRYLQYFNTDENYCKRTIIGGTPRNSVNMSYYGRLAWDYADKYNLQFIMRADAFESSKLAKKNRWGKFPSVSAGWTLSKEDFLVDILSSATVSYLKLRANWGQNGNIAVLNNYPYSVDVTLNSQKYQFDTKNGKISYGSYVDGLPNPDLKWETTEQVGVGLDGRLLNDKLSFVADYYVKTTKDLLVPVTPAKETGVLSTTINAGKVVNKGLEIELTWKDKIGDLKYSVSGNAATLKNEVTYLDPTVGRIDGANFANHQLKTTFEEGHTIWYMRGYEYVGVCTYEQAVERAKLTDDDPSDFAGKPLFKTDRDIEADKAVFGEGITVSPKDEDMRDLGHGIATFSYGLTLNLEYKNFDFTVFGTGVSGNKIWACNYRTEHPRSNGMKLFYEGRSIGEYNEDDEIIGISKLGKYPTVDNMKTHIQFYSSSANDFDGSYFKIKQIQLGYTVPRELTKKIAVESFRAFVALDDYFTFTKYEGFDPEVASNGTANSIGVDKGSFPSSKKVTFGFNLTF